MEKIMAYKTKDGKLFECEIEAKNHEHYLDFTEWYENDNQLQLYAPSALVVYNWLNQKRDKILEVVNRSV